MKLKVFIGPKGSGKDTCAKILQDAGIIAGKIPFAGPLKQICSKVFAIPVHLFEDPDFKESLFTSPEVLHPWTLAAIGTEMDKYVRIRSEDWTALKGFSGLQLTSPRHMLQFIGTEIIRNAIDKDWHVKAAFSHVYIDEMFDGTDICRPFSDHIFAVTDCRFLSEHEYLRKNHDCEFFYVERPEAEAGLAMATHQSELEVKELRKYILSIYTIQNNRTLNHLITQVLNKCSE